MKTYEAMFLLDNREVKKGWEPLKESIDSIMTKRGAEIVVAKRWDERKLAYDIKKQRRATYYLSYFKAEPAAIDEVRRDLELSVPVLRYLILACEAIPEDAYEPEKEFTMVEEEDDSVAKATAARDSAAGDSEAGDSEAGDSAAGDSAAGEDSEVKAVEETVATAEAVATAAVVAAAETTTEAVTGEAVVEIAETEKPEENKE